MRISPNFQAAREPDADSKRNEGQNEAQGEKVSKEAIDFWAPFAPKELTVGYLGKLAESSSKLTKEFNEVSARIGKLAPGSLRDKAIELKDQLALVIEGLDDEMLAQGKAAAELIGEASPGPNEELEGSKTKERS